MRYIVESIEDGIASLEDIATREIVRFNISDIPFLIREGDVLVLENTIWYQDEEERKCREERIQKKMKDLWI